MDMALGTDLGVGPDPMSAMPLEAWINQLVDAAHSEQKSNLVACDEILTGIHRRLNDTLYGGVKDNPLRARILFKLYGFAAVKALQDRQRNEAAELLSQTVEYS